MLTVQYIHYAQYNICQLIGEGTDSIIMNIAKKGKLSTQSLLPHYEVGRGEEENEEYMIVGDYMGRTFTIKNNKDEIVAQVAKTTKALIQNAVLGTGSESTIDIAPGVDCSTILAIIYGMEQVGKFCFQLLGNTQQSSGLESSEPVCHFETIGSHFIKDALGNFIIDPMKDNAIDGAIDATGMGGLAASYTKVSKQGEKLVHLGSQLQKMFK
jgi:hypothetical protein